MLRASLQAQIDSFENDWEVIDNVLKRMALNEKLLRASGRQFNLAAMLKLTDV